MERAALDAFCRGSGTTFARSVHEDQLGVELGAIHPELQGSRPADWLPEPHAAVAARHTVGLGDPLLAHQVPAEERVGDGLPHALADAAREYGLTRFKIKVSGNLESDVPRLRAVAEVLEASSPPLSLHARRQRTVRRRGRLPRALGGVPREPALRALFDRRLLYVEQPLHRGAL